MKIQCLGLSRKQARHSTSTMVWFSLKVFWSTAPFFKHQLWELFEIIHRGSSPELQEGRAAAGVSSPAQEEHQRGGDEEDAE